MTYQGGKWVKWVTFLYNNGNMCTNITGGWNYTKVTVAYNMGTVTIEAESITIHCNVGGYEVMYYVINKINLTAVKIFM